ncbi:RIP homotypic interaction motif-containing protein [Actinoplanes awajinensis]|uniref:RIP homotypic interaction motif-containing protein n=1 Tax=Actinoplanes awajinensis TaxID=135946 RepID=UPI001E651C68|nr:RIP homotypic interaction motif-containing protein [Actinoplanes awajinensis]
MELIVTALSAGAAAGLTDTASTAVKDGYAALKRTLWPWVRGDARQALETDVIDGEVLEAELVASGADVDEQVLAAAQHLLQVVDPANATKYRIQITDAKGVQVGDHNTQTNTF